MSQSINNPQVPNVDVIEKNEDEYGVGCVVNEQSEDELHDVPLTDNFDPSKWPRVKLTKIELVNFGKYEDAVIDFTHDGSPMPLVVLVGPNGTGKTTILDAVSMLCSNFSNYEPQRFSDMMLRRVRNWMHLNNDDQIRNASFSVKGHFQATYSSLEEPYNSNLEIPSGANIPLTRSYVVEFTRHKFRQRHPDFIEQRLPRYCFSSRFDHELTIFQMRRDRWPLFQELFSSVTGFPVEEDVDMFHDTSDTRMRRILDEYVLGFTVKKPKETIRHKMCSSGEKKIAKCFSTIINARIEPSIILVDNVLMHIEVGRHLAVMDCLSKCFPNSQLIVACHSVPVSKALPSRQHLFDMRNLDIPGLMWREPWRLRLTDDISDSLERMSSIPERMMDTNSYLFVDRGAELLHNLATDNNSREVMSKSLEWLAQFPYFLAGDLLNTPTPKMSWHDNRQLY